MVSGQILSDFVFPYPLYLSLLKNSAPRVMQPGKERQRKTKDKMGNYGDYDTRRFLRDLTLD